MNIKNALAGISVNDIEAAIIWYHELVGRPPDIRPMPGVAGWQFRGGGWIEVFEDAERAGLSTVIFAIESLQEQLDIIAGMGLEVEKKEIPSIGTITLIRDPDGNRIAFADPTTGVLDD